MQLTKWRGKGKENEIKCTTSTGNTTTLVPVVEDG